MSFINYLRVNDSEKKCLRWHSNRLSLSLQERTPYVCVLVLNFGRWRETYIKIVSIFRKLFFNVIRLRWALWVIILELFYIPFVNTSILFRDSYIIQLVHKTMTGKYYMGRCDLILIHVFKIFVIVFSTCIFYQIQSKFSKRKMYCTSLG